MFGLKWTDERTLKGGGWCLWTTIIGLFQLIIVFSFQFFKGLNIEFFSSIITGGSLLFFCTSLVGGICIDQFYSRKTCKNMLLFFYCYIVVPLAVVFFSLIVFIICYFDKPDLEPILIAQEVIIAITLMYVFLIKFRKVEI